MPATKRLASLARASKITELLHAAVCANGRRVRFSSGRGLR
jgi:hypothetical protein